MKIGEIAAASTQTLKSTFTPEILVLVAADLTKIDTIKSNVYGQGILMDLDQTGIKYLDAQGQVSDDTASYTLPCGDGKFNTNACDITIKNSQAGAVVEVYGFGSRKGTMFLKHETRTYLAGNEIVLNKFAFVAIPGATAADLITVVFNVKDPQTGEIIGTYNEQMTREELKAIAGFAQWNNGYMINNYNQQIKEVRIYPSTDRTVYITSFVEPKA